MTVDTIEHEKEFPQFEEHRVFLKKRLENKRFHHSLCVAEAAVALAGQYGANREKAYFAGLMHDVCKNDDLAKTLQLFRDNGIILNAVEKNSPKLWHAMAGALLISNDFQVQDADIINAIRYHTTARAGMSLLEKIIYIADFISADRDYPDVEVVRLLAFNSLDQAILYTASYTMIRLTDSKLPVHPDMLGAYNDAAVLLGCAAATFEKKDLSTPGNF